ncbi:MAG: hypothetical protein RIQ54_417, partial [Candidatus Parcubacteria bacterium]
MTQTDKGFHGLGIAPALLTTLQKIGFSHPTPIQEQSIPVAIEGKDIMGIAQTGTGKTLAFGIPLIQQLLQNESGAGAIVVPTRELALQVNESLAKIAMPLGIRTAVLIGGEPIYRQIRQLERNPHIIIGTPGRIIDHLEQKTMSLWGVSILVLDEADRMLDMGFAPQLKKIMESVPPQRQTMLFSATMPEEIVGIAKTYLKMPVRVEIARPGSTADHVTQELFFVSQDHKLTLLETLLQKYRGSVLVFSRLKFGAKKIAAHLRAVGHTAAEIHANRSLAQRREALDGFKRGRYRILVATDIAARGIDVSNIELVLNYDLPDNPEDYVHRIGRTGRAGGSGHAISFARPNEKGDVKTIERLIRATLPVSKLPESMPESARQTNTPDLAPTKGYRGRSSSRGSARTTPRGRSWTP